MSKFGPCTLCPKNGPHVRLYGDGVCVYHLGNPADDQSKQKIERVASLVLTERELNAWYAQQFAERTPLCENCNRVYLVDPVEGWRRKAMVAHILPKRPKGGFPSVATHPLNRWFACPQCHHDYDRGWSFAIKMPIWKLCVERFTEFMTEINVGEHRLLPKELRALVDQHLAE